MSEAVDKTATFSREHQYDLLELSFYRLTDAGEVPEKSLWVDLASMLEELNIFEDIMQPTVTGQLLLTDGFNLIDRLPILGGERLRIRFKTASFEKEVSLVMVIHKVGERIFSTRNTDKAQMYWLYLSSEDAWTDAQVDSSFGFKGTYDGLVKKSLELLGSKRPADIMPTIDICEFVAPYWSPLRIATFASKRAATEDGDPVFFFETTEGYRLVNLKTIYNQAPVKKIFIEPRNTNSILEHGDKLFNMVTNWNYAQSDNKLVMNRKGAFGADVYKWDVVNWNVTRETLAKDAIEVIRIDKYPILDSVAKLRAKTDFITTRNDGSERFELQRDAVMNRIDNKRVVVEIPGDSNVHAGQVIDLDVPSMTAGLEYVKERVASGKFLIASAKHVLIRDRYRLNLELLKDATEERVL